MGSAVGDEVRRTVRSPYPLVLLAVAAVVVAVAAAGLMPVNEAYYVTLVNYDPQGPAQALQRYYTEGIFRYTSGHLVGQFLALLFGAGLVLGERATGSRHGRPPATAAIRAMTAKVIVAVAGGAILALVNLAVVGPLAAARTPPAPPAAEVRAAGLSFNPDLPHDPALFRVVLLGLLAFPVYAAAGCLLGAVLARWDRLVAAGLLWWSAWLAGAMLVSFLPTGRIQAPLLVLVPPAGAFAAVSWTASAQYLGADPTPAGDVGLATACLLLGPVAYAALLFPVWLLLRRRRLRGARRGVGSAA